MGNHKQDGSNLKNTEYYTGRCPSQCEQCFVNFGQQGLTVVKNIQHPSQGAWRKYARSQGWKGGPWAVPKSPKREELATRRQKTVKVGDMVLPCFLRVSSMSDSSLSPAWWIQQVRDVWGDFCFFNSAIKSVKSHPENMDLYHKLVVTMNPGKQALPKSFGTGEMKAADVKGSMGKRGPMDFLTPASLTDLGLGGYESIIKFYRLRALATVWPYIHGVPAHDLTKDVPIVVTQMRFKSLAHCCEFARKYKLNIEVGCSLSANHVKTLKAFGLEHVASASPNLVVKLWTSAKDNASPYAGEASVLHFSSGFLRPSEYAENAWPLFPYVCDRAYGGCGECGLCASLDGTEPSWDNKLNPFAPTPFQKGYVGSTLSEEGDYFDSILGSVLRFRSNPGEGMEEQPLEWIEAALGKVTEYLLQGDPDGDFFCEGWNTHEDATTLTAYCYWCLIREAKRGGMSRADAKESIEDFVSQATGGYSVSGGCGDLWGMWDDSSDWIDQFGSTSVER